MKNLLFVLALAVSGSGFGSELSEFERGFREGKVSCIKGPPPTEGVLCTLPATGRYLAGSFLGRTKAEAFMKALPDALAAVYDAGKEPRCIAF